MSDDVGKLAVARYNREIAAREAHNAEVDTAVEAVRAAIATKDDELDDWVHHDDLVKLEGKIEAALTRLAELAKQGPGT